jgi:hypothetical protein
VRFADVELLEEAAASADADPRWVVRGADVVLCLDLVRGRVEVTPRQDGRCDLRLVDVPFDDVERVLEGLQVEVAR